MPVQVDYQGSTVQITPAPLVSVSTQILKNGAGEPFGVSYAITLTGTVLDNKGSPYAFYGPSNTLYNFVGGGSPTVDGPYGAFSTASSATQQLVPRGESLTAVMSKQSALRALFATDGQKLAITDWNTGDPNFVCYPRVISVDFQEGAYVERADYTITLEADTLLFGEGDPTSSVENEGSLIASDGVARAGITESQLLASLSGAFIADFSEDWAIEVDEAQGESVELPRSYRVTHNINATGKTHFGPPPTPGSSPIKYKAWEQAKKFVQHRLSENATEYPNIMGKIGSGTVNLVNTYRGFNHTRTENLSESAGTYSVSETWLIASGTAYENYNLSISSSTSAPFVSVSIDGNIKGLTEYSPSGFGGSDLNVGSSGAYDNALIKYRLISNNGFFGVGSDIYKRANNAVAVELNSQPKSISLGTNAYTGELTYNLEFDNRPTNIISGVLSEQISVNDTYPGDVFATIPVIGRSTGPVLQYLGSRTEYKRDVSINLLMDYTNLPYTSGNNLIRFKPSVVQPTAGQIQNLLAYLSPANEPGIRKYFVAPPTESWNPKEGSYAINISWTYELNY